MNPHSTLAASTPPTMTSTMAGSSSNNEIDAATRNTTATTKTVAITPPHSPVPAASPALELDASTDDQTYALHQLLVEALKPDAEDDAMERYQLGVESLYASQLVATTAAVRLAAVEQRALDALSEVKKVAAAAMMISGRHSVETRETIGPAASLGDSGPASPLVCSHVRMVQAGNSAAAWSGYLQVLSQGKCRACKAWAEAERLRKFRGKQKSPGAIGSHGTEPDATQAVHRNSGIAPGSSSIAQSKYLQKRTGTPEDQDETDAGKPQKDTPEGVNFSSNEPGAKKTSVISDMLEEIQGAANREIETASSSAETKAADDRTLSGGIFGAHEAAADHRQRADQLSDTYRRDGDLRGVIALLRANHEFAISSGLECGTRMSQSSQNQHRSEYGMAQLVHDRAANRYKNMLASIDAMERASAHQPRAQCDEEQDITS